MSLDEQFRGVSLGRGQDGQTTLQWFQFFEGESRSVCLEPYTGARQPVHGVKQLFRPRLADKLAFKREFLSSLSQLRQEFRPEVHGEPRLHVNYGHLYTWATGRDLNLHEFKNMTQSCAFESTPRKTGLDDVDKPNKISETYDVWFQDTRKKGVRVRLNEDFKAEKVESEDKWVNFTVIRQAATDFRLRVMTRRHGDSVEDKHDDLWHEAQRMISRYSTGQIKVEPKSEYRRYHIYIKHMKKKHYTKEYPEYPALGKVRILERTVTELDDLGQDGRFRKVTTGRPELTVHWNNSELLSRINDEFAESLWDLALELGNKHFA